jgi:hypothetical protein
MKKLFLSLALVAAGVAAQAQKPAAGNMTLETQFSLDMGGPNGFTTPEIRYRYFLSESIAARVRLGINSNSNTRAIDNGLVNNKETGEIKTSQFGFELGLGVEKHLSGTSKLSPYFGGELFLGSQGALQTTATGSDDGNVWTGKDDTYETAGGSTFNIGLKGVFGADYYFTESIYLGGEMGWGVAMGSTSEQTEKTKTGTAAAVENVLNRERSSLNLGMMNFPTASIRFGVKF